MRLVWLFVIFAPSVVEYECAFESLDESEKHLLGHLKNSSGVNLRPVNISSTPVEIDVTMNIVRLDTVSEKGQSVRMKLHVNYEWRNPFLVWNPIAFGNISEVILMEKDVWVPPIQLFNEASKSYGEFQEPIKDRTILVSSDGICSLTYAKYFKSTCEIDVSDFPFDEQICDLVFGSWSMDERLMSLRAVNKEAIDSLLYKENGEWELSNAILKSESVKYPIQRRKHSTVKLEILIRRKYLFFVMNLVVPCALIASMIFLVFVLPAKSGERISLGITVMLSMAIFQELSSEKLPSSSDNYPLLGIYYTTSMFEIGLALIANCLILNIFYREYDMPSWLRRLLFDKISKLVRIDVPHTRMQHYFEKMKDQQYQEFDPLTETTISNSAANDTDNVIRKTSDWNPPSNQDCSMNNINHRTKKYSTSQNDINFNQTAPRLSRHFSIIPSATTSDAAVRIEERKLLAEDWKRAARILDRVMLIVATSIGVLSFIIIFCHASRFRDMFKV